MSCIRILGRDATSAARVLAHQARDGALSQEVEHGEAAPDEERRQFYRRLSLADGDAKVLGRYLRKDPAPRVTLVHRTPSPFDGLAAPINKVLFAHVRGRPGIDVDVIEGSLEASDEPGETARIVTSADEIRPVRTSRILVRHGAVPAAAGLLSHAELQALRDKPRAVLEASVPNRVDWAFYGKALTGGPRKGSDTATDARQINTMLDYITQHSRKAHLATYTTGEWVVFADGEIGDLIRLHLPIKTRRFSVNYGGPSRPVRVLE